MTTETIFDLNPTADEFTEMDHNYSGLNLEEYFSKLRERAEVAGTNVDFERVSDLEELSEMRGNKEDFEKYHKILTVDMVDTWNKVFNE